MVYEVCCFFLRCFFRPLFRSRIEGLEHLPANGPAIVVANHVSYLDPPILGAFLPRQIRFMAKEELFKIPILSTILHWCGVFPVRRGRADRRAIRKAFASLAAGEIVGLFPEGRRVGPGEEADGELGAALLALKSGAPVIPVAILGTQPWWERGWFARAVVRLGPPVELAAPEAGTRERELLLENTRRIMAAIHALKHRSA